MAKRARFAAMIVGALAGYVIGYTLTTQPPQQPAAAGPVPPGPVSHDNSPATARGEAAWHEFVTAHEGL